MSRIAPVRPQPPARPDPVHRTVVGVEGAVAVAFGIYALTHVTTATLLVAGFAAFAIVAGAIRAALGLREIGRDRAWWLHALMGAGAVGVGVLAFETAHGLLDLTWLVAKWTAIAGVVMLAFGAAAFRRVPGAWLWAIGGVIALLFAGWFLWITKGGLLTTGVALGLFALIFGLGALATAIRGRWW